VLFGLEYLHAQGVLHRDIKGANILTTKTGVAKLADFGVAARAASFGGADLDDDIVGSPYWMAPEIIEMSAPPSTACDIWSLGCTILELTTGKPPYFDLTPMAALFRIVQDDVPRLPAGASEALKDFLLQCFNRESALRAGAKILLNHAWLQRAPVRSMRTHDIFALEGLGSRDLGSPKLSSPASRLVRVKSAPFLDGDEAGWYFADDAKKGRSAVILNLSPESVKYNTEVNSSSLLSSPPVTKQRFLSPRLVNPQANDMLNKYRETGDDNIEDGLVKRESKVSPTSSALAHDSTMRKISSQTIDHSYHTGVSSMSLPISNSVLNEINWDTDLWDMDFETDVRVSELSIKWSSITDKKDNVIIDPFAVGFFEDDRDFVHDVLRERESRKREEVDLLLMELVTRQSYPSDCESVSSRLLKLLKPVDGENNLLSEFGAVYLLEVLRSPSCAIEILEITNAVLVACPNAADLLAGLGVAPLLASLPVIDNPKVLDLLGMILDSVRIRCSEPSLRAFVSGGGLQLAIELLLRPGERTRTPSRYAVALAGVEFLLRILDASTVKLKPHCLPRAALCRALALRDAPAKLAASLEASLDMDTSIEPRDADAITRALAALCDADTVVKETIAEPKTATVILRVLATFPVRVASAWKRGADGDTEAKLAARILKAIKTVSMASAAALDSLASCNAIETAVTVLKAVQTGVIEANCCVKRPVPRRDELEDQLVPIVYYLCRIDRSRLARAARCGAATLLADCVARRRHLKQFALAVLCELCHVAANDAQGDIGAELWHAGGVRLYARLLVEAYWGVRALAALNAWLKADTKVEAAMAEPQCALSVVLLFQRLDTAEFEQTLSPLLDACETSPQFARALLDVRTENRRHAFAIELGRKLERHVSAIVRKALLEILRAVLAASDAPRALLIASSLNSVLASLLTDERTSGQVLVIDLAGTVLGSL